VRRAAVDLLVVADLPFSGLNTIAAQRIGERQVLLRLSGDRRDFDKGLNETAYFGGLGTRFVVTYGWLTFGRPESRDLRPVECFGDRCSFPFLRSCSLGLR
jgi:hypothetical protein